MLVAGRKVGQERSSLGRVRAYRPQLVLRLLLVLRTIRMRLLLCCATLI